MHKLMCTFMTPMKKKIPDRNLDTSCPAGIPCKNKWRENLKETTRLMTSQASSLKITNLILELQYGLMAINFDRAHVHTHTHTHTHTLNKLVKNYSLTEVNT